MTHVLPSGDELNPNHPVSIEFRELWHKIAFLLVARIGTETIITSEEIKATMDKFPNHAILFEPTGQQGRNLRLSIVTMEEAQRMARKEGGLPA